jgi:general transcription factor 3C polypeptide 3 (transcription factor C subunit 4)
MINLNIGLGYIHHALKQQAENRQHFILQGLTFLFKYYKSRYNSLIINEQEEAYYTIARVYYILGLEYLIINHDLFILENSLNNILF